MNPTVQGGLSMIKSVKCGVCYLLDGKIKICSCIKSKNNKLVHKSYMFSFYDKALTRCDQLLNEPMSRFWKDVTCKDCLLRKKLKYD